jgi:RsiW-degrading membrane proteinase PrsW (M82 family)
MTKQSRSPVGTLNEITHTDPFRLTDVLQMFSRVFLRHDSEDVETQFGVGLPATTPPLGAVHDRVARPWFFARVLLFLGLAFVIVLITYRATGYPVLVPAIVLTGSFAAPLAVAIFFFECNLPANVSLYMVLRMFTWGGLLGIVLSLILFKIDEALPTAWLGASVAALIEEPGKLMAVVLLASRRKYPWTLNGLCLGAAVGAGFAAFESAGYALNSFLETLRASRGLAEANAAMQHSLLLRGILSPFGHVVWTAITAGALWRVVHDSPLRTSSLADWRFVSPFIAAVLLHFTWNSPLLWSLPYSAKPILLGAIAWTIAFGLLFTGFREVRETAAGVSYDA